MLELFSKINEDDLLSFNDNKTKKVINEFQSNIVFFDYQENSFKAYNLTDCYDESGNVNLDKFYKNLNQHDFLSDLIKEIKKEEAKNNLQFNIFEFLSPDNIFNFSKKYNNDIINIKSLVISNEKSIGGNQGPNLWVVNSGYIAAKKKEEEQDSFYKNFNKKNIEWYKDFFIKEIKKNKIKKGHQTNINILNDIDMFDEKLINFDIDENSLIKEIKNIDIDFSKSIIFINNYFDLVNKITINKLQESILNFYVEKFYSIEDSLKGACKICNKKEDLIVNKDYNDNREELTHIFSLEGKKEDGKYINTSFIICKDCNNDLKTKEKIIKKERINYLKISLDNINEKTQTYNNLSEIHSSNYEKINRNAFYKLEVADKKAKKENLRFKLLFNVNNKIDNKIKAENFNILQRVFYFKEINSKEKYIQNWLDKINNDGSEKITIELNKSRIIKNNSKHLYDYWLKDKAISQKVINQIIDFYIKNKNNEMFSKWNPLFDLFIFLELESKGNNYLENYSEKKIISINNKKYGIKKTLINHMRKEEMMYEKHKLINEKLKSIEEKENELEDLNLDFSDEEFWILVGTIIGYLYNKNKSENDNLSYLNDFQNITKKSMINLLNRFVLKYGHEISNKQIKFKLIYSYVLEELDSNNRKIDEYTKSSLLSGVLNTKIIKLTKTK